MCLRKISAHLSNVATQSHANTHMCVREGVSERECEYYMREREREMMMSFICSCRNTNWPNAIYRLNISLW